MHHLALFFFSGRSCRPLFRIYSDASHTGGVRTRLGWVLFTKNAATPMGYWYDISASLLQDWELTHPFMTVEAFAVLTAIWQHRDLLTGKDVIFFIDNEAAASAMIKGDSRLPQVGTMAMCVQLLLIRYNIAVWFEWVDSDSNLAGWPQQRWCGRPLDFGSRLGITRIPRPSFRSLACLAARTIFSRVC